MKPSDFPSFPFRATIEFRDTAERSIGDVIGMRLNMSALVFERASAHADELCQLVPISSIKRLTIWKEPKSVSVDDAPDH